MNGSANERQQYELKQLEGFFQQPDAKDSLYNLTRDSEESHVRAGRDFIERIWKECASFVDEDALQKARNDLYPVFWELYLSYALRECGVSLVPRKDRRLVDNQGPDLVAIKPTVSIEAVMPKCGDGADALKKPELGVAYRVPTDAFVLRLCGVIRDKADKLKKYIEQGIVNKAAPTVIAVSTARLEHKFSELPIPRIVRAVLGVGDLILNIDRKNRKTVDYGVEYCDSLTKSGGSPVRTDLFLDPSFAHVSALLYSYADWVHHPYKAGTEFVVVHNSLAVNPLQRQWLNVGDEYWREGAELLFNRHSES